MFAPPITKQFDPVAPWVPFPCKDCVHVGVGVGGTVLLVLVMMELELEVELEVELERELVVVVVVDVRVVDDVDDFGFGQRIVSTKVWIVSFRLPEQRVPAQDWREGTRSGHLQRPTYARKIRNLSPKLAEVETKTPKTPKEGVCMDDSHSKLPSGQ